MDDRSMQNQCQLGYLQRTAGGHQTNKTIESFLQTYIQTLFAFLLEPTEGLKRFLHISPRTEQRTKTRQRLPQNRAHYRLARQISRL